MQDLNALDPMLVHVDGIFTSGRDVHPLNDESPIVDALSISTCSSLLHPLNALLDIFRGLLITNCVKGLSANAESSRTSTVVPDPKLIDCSGNDENALLPMFLILIFAGTLTVVMLGALPKIDDVILSNESGIVNVFNEVHPTNAFCPID